ncbi:hypothetical protein Ae706Ps2_3781 [Pseudonocardia sp. Ae706_Ps2]|nr:hypothetical protein Ae505Ps2_1480c [Pseudonocardia sp. Ae505_Ps2]OLM25348.1 hypothetical protein Ae706Ps2_3781 [Pseudonocardia sp. Ae706_Ps2]
MPTGAPRSWGDQDSPDHPRNQDRQAALRRQCSM